MISYDEVLNLNYYKKTSYTGWTGEMRFLIRREQPEGGDAVFHVFAWPGPYIFERADGAKILDTSFPFSEEGKRQAVDWLNGFLAEKPALWQ